MSALAEADDAVRAVLEAQWRGVPATRGDAPPGSGKTGLVERAAALSLGVLHERCAVATTTNEQCFDLARRLARAYPRLGFVLWVSEKLELPGDLRALANLAIATDVGALPAGPCVVLANAAKWSWLRGSVAPFDLLVVDEAFQLPDYRYQQIAGLARRQLLVGDPGQIAPVIASPIERWRCDPAGPHVPCPEALVARRPDVLRVRLPVSRRLVADTVAVVQPAFYPALPFAAATPDGARALRFDVSGTLPADRALDLAAQGASLVLAELPARVTGEADDDLSRALAAMVARGFARGATVLDEGREAPLRPEDVGVVCAHVTQVNAVRALLPAGCERVLVETAERFQGLERAVMFVHHPLSGRAAFSDFQLDAGRLCVMTSRHRVACVLLARAGLDARLARHAPVGDRVLGRARDDEHAGWTAHRTLLGALRDRRRCVPLG